MARIRTIKPEIARHEGLFEAEKETGLPLRFTWAVFPTACDREGRFKWRPRSMKADILPYDDLEFGDVLEVLRQRGFLIKYRLGSEWYGHVPTFAKHQHVNHKEVDSTIPGPDQAEEIVPCDARVDDAWPDLGILSPHGRGREGKGIGRERNGGSLELPDDSAPPVLTFPTVGPHDASWALRTQQLAEWRECFPSQDVLAECRKALAWVLANPGRKKTARGMPKFLVGWLSRANDRGRPETPTRRAAEQAPAYRGGWDCDHVDRCDHKPMCDHKHTLPKKYPVKAVPV